MLLLPETCERTTNLSGGLDSCTEQGLCHEGIVDDLVAEAMGSPPHVFPGKAPTGIQRIVLEPICHPDADEAA